MHQKQCTRIRTVNRRTPQSRNPLFNSSLPRVMAFQISYECAAFAEEVADE